MSLIRKFIITMMVFSIVACGKSPEKNDFISKGDTVVAFGDSVTYGHGNVPRDKTYPAQLAKLTGWNVINEGISGERADQARERIATVLIQYKPTAVLIELGGNDFL